MPQPDITTEFPRPANPPTGHGGGGGNNDLVNHRLKELEGSVKELATDVKSLGNDVISLKEKIDNVPTKNYLSLWLVGLLFAAAVTVIIHVLLRSGGSP